jgi:hypothetical protein
MPVVSTRLAIHEIERGFKLALQHSLPPRGIHKLYEWVIFIEDRLRMRIKACVSGSIGQATEPLHQFLA